MARIACFGEVILRLSPRGDGTLQEARELELFVGGAEANVAVGLSRLGHEARMITTLPDNHLGERALAALCQERIDTSFVISGQGRMGLYFAEGFGPADRGNTLYDREHSAFAKSSASSFDFTRALNDVDLVLLGGITPALGEGPAAAALTLVREARARGVPVAFDCNYRPHLWEGSCRDPASVLSPIVEAASILFANHLDAAYLAGYGGDDQHEASKALFERFVHLDLVIGTRRASLDDGAITVQATADRRSSSSDAGPIFIRDHIGRIGSGDAFAAGMLHGMLKGIEDREALNLGLTAMRLKHGTPGDMPEFHRKDFEFPARCAGDV